MKKKSLNWLVVIFLVSGFESQLVGCSDENSDDSSGCTQGETQQCYCINGQTGAQTCDTAGSWGTCSCEDSFGNGSNSSSDTNSNITKFCERADECNALPNGTSATECAEGISSCVNGLLISSQKDWNLYIEACFEFSSCESFISCYNEDVPNC